MTIDAFEYKNTSSILAANRQNTRTHERTHIYTCILGCKW